MERFPAGTADGVVFLDLGGLGGLDNIGSFPRKVRGTVKIEDTDINNGCGPVFVEAANGEVTPEVRVGQDRGGRGCGSRSWGILREKGWGIGGSRGARMGWPWGRVGWVVLCKRGSRVMAEGGKQSRAIMMSSSRSSL